MRSQGKQKCELIKDQVFKVLTNLLEHESITVRKFVNGTIYILLYRQVFIDKAKELGMNEILQYLIKNSDEKCKNQI